MRHKTFSFFTLFTLFIIQTSYSFGLDLNKAYAVRVQKVNGLENSIIGVRQDIGRPGTYWTIGTHFNPDLDLGTHGEDNLIAILTPLNNLLPQIINLSPFDTFVLGEIDLGQHSGVIIFVPESLGNPCSNFVNQFSEKVTIKTYQGSDRDSLFASIDRFFSSQEQIDDSIKLKENSEGFDIALSSEDININHPDFFKNILRHKPYVSFGWTSNSIRSPLMKYYDVTSEMIRKTFSDSDLYILHAYPLYPKLFLDNIEESHLPENAKDMARVFVDNALNSKIPLPTVSFSQLPTEEQVEVIQSLAANHVKGMLNEELAWIRPYVKMIEILASLGEAINVEVNYSQHPKHQKRIEIACRYKKILGELELIKSEDQVALEIFEEIKDLCQGNDE